MTLDGKHVSDRLGNYLLSFGGSGYNSNVRKVDINGILVFDKNTRSNVSARGWLSGNSIIDGDVVNGLFFAGTGGQWASYRGADATLMNSSGGVIMHKVDIPDVVKAQHVTAAHL